MDGGTADVVVGIVTHRRPESLAALLERLTTLRFGNGPAPRMGVVVVDNSQTSRDGRSSRAPVLTVP